MNQKDWMTAYRPESRGAQTGYNRLFEHSIAGMLRADVDGYILDANGAMSHLLGVPAVSDLVGRRTADFFSSADFRDDLLAQLNAGASIRGAEIRLKRADSAPVWVVGNLDLAEGESTVIEGTFIESRDTGAHSDAEATLLASNRRIASILERISDAFFALDREWRYTYLNGRAEQILGRNREDLEGKNIWEEFPELAGSVFEQEYRRAAAEDRPIEFSAFDPVRKLWADVRVYPSGHGLSVYFQDASARKALEEQLRAVATDGGARKACRRSGARFQQSADHHRRLQPA